MPNILRDQTVYAHLRKAPPKCFSDVQAHLRPKLPRARHPRNYRPFALAENLCRRLGDVELYATKIKQLDSRRRIAHPALISSYLVGHFSSCKAVLDAGSIALAECYELGTRTGATKHLLPFKKQDFGNSHFWRVLENEQKAAHARYLPMKATMDEIVLWRDAAVHRVSPLVLGHRKVDPETKSFVHAGYLLVRHLEANDDKLVDMGMPVEWGSPLYFHDRWFPALLTLCDEVCRDIIETS